METKTPMVSATLYSASITNGKFNKDHKTLVNAPKMINRNYAEDFNERAKNSGKWFEFDEEATAKFYRLKAEKSEVRKEMEEVEAQTGELLVEAVKTIKRGRKNK